MLGGVPGVPPAEVVVLGGGVSGTHAATIALGMGATVFVVDRSGEALRRIAAQFPTLRTIFSTHDALAHILRRADLLIGAVLVPGASAPRLQTDPQQPQQPAHSPAARRRRTSAWTAGKPPARPPSRSRDRPWAPSSRSRSGWFGSTRTSASSL